MFLRKRKTVLKLVSTLYFIFISLCIFSKVSLKVTTQSLKVWKWPLKQKCWEKKLYHVNQHQKYYKLCFDNFSLQRLFLTALLIAVKLNFGETPRAQDNLSKLVLLLAPTPFKFMHIFGKGVGARRRARWPRWGRPKINFEFWTKLSKQDL